MADSQDRDFDLQQARLRAEQAAREADLSLKRREFLHRRAMDKHARRVAFTPAMTALIAGVLSLATGGVTAFLGGFWSLRAQEERNRGELQLKESERQFQIVVKATENRTPEDAARNLLFFVDIGYLPDPGGKIRAKAVNRETPVITSGVNPLLERHARLSQSHPTGAAGGGYRVVDHVLLDASGPVSAIPTPNLKPGLSPRLIVLHSTGNGSFQQSAALLTDEQIRASAHVMIDRDGKVAQLVPFDYISWHAGVASYKGLDHVNNYGIGIELVNWGLLEKKGGQWVTPHSHQPIAEEDVFVDARGQGWQKYTERQIQAVADIGKALALAYPAMEDVVGHDQIAPLRKTDPGPAFPIDRVRRSILDRSR